MAWVPPLITSGGTKSWNNEKFGKEEKVCHYMKIFSHWTTEPSSSEGEYYSLEFKSASTWQSNLAMDKPFGIEYSVKFFCLCFNYIQFLITSNEMVFLSIYAPKTQYKHSKMLLRLKPQMSASSRCKVLTTFSTIFAALACLFAMMLVAILWPWHLKD